MRFYRLQHGKHPLLLCSHLIHSFASFARNFITLFRSSRRQIKTFLANSYCPYCYISIFYLPTVCHCKVRHPSSRNTRDSVAATFANILFLCCLFRLSQLRIAKMSGMLRSAGENLDWKELMKLVYGERGLEGW